MSDYLPSYDSAEVGDKTIIGDLRVEGKIEFIPSAVFITNITGGNVNIDWLDGTSPTNKVVDSVESDATSLTVSVEVDAGPGAWQPTVTVNGEAVTLTRIGSDQEGRRFSGSVAITMSESGDITALCNDYGVHVVPFTLLVGPAITSAVFDTHPTNTGGDPNCPYSQTQVSDDDTVRITGTMESGAVYIYVKDSELSSSLQEFAVSGTSFDITVQVGSRTGASQHCTLYAKDSDGAQGDDYQTTNTIAQDQTYPTFGTPSIEYPTNQLALKASETCNVTLACTNYDASDTVSYTDNGTSELTIPNSAEYAATKNNVQRAGGTYRDTGTNYKLAVTRSGRNGRSANGTTTVWIANVAPPLTVTITGTPARLRSKTGTAKTYEITLSSTHYLIENGGYAKPNMERDGSDDGPALPVLSGTSPDKTWTATMTIEEDDTKNTGSTYYSWASVTAYGPSGLQSTSITTNPNYTVGGFEERDVAFSQYEEYQPIGTMATNKDNANLIDCECVGVGEMTYYTDTNQHSMGFTITNDGGTYDPDGDYVRCLDSDIYDNVDYTLRIEERIS